MLFVFDERNALLDSVSPTYQCHILTTDSDGAQATVGGEVLCTATALLYLLPSW